MNDSLLSNMTHRPDPTPGVLTVSQLNQTVGRLLERSFPLTWVAGELSNVTSAASGHWYFTLKDAGRSGACRDVSGTCAVCRLQSARR